MPAGAVTLLSIAEEPQFMSPFAVEALGVRPFRSISTTILSFFCRVIALPVADLVYSVLVVVSSGEFMTVGTMPVNLASLESAQPQMLILRARSEPVAFSFA